MTRLLICAVGLATVGPAWAQETAQAKAAKRLEVLLAPSGGIAVKAEPKSWRAPPALENQTLALASYSGMTPPLPKAPRQAVQPGAVPEGQPLAAFRDPPAVPKTVGLPEKPLIHIPSVNVHQPLPLPILAKPVVERASLADPALEASLDAALKPLAPKRTRPVPFTPLNLPDPFEYVQAGQLRNPPDENPMPPDIPLRTPAK
jgi:hypothetical protein